MHRVLALNESLEQFRDRLAKEKGVPIYIASCEHKSQTHYRKPGELEYKPIGTLELFLSRWRSVHEKREDFGEYGTDSYSSNFYARLEEAPYIHIVYPFDADKSDPEDKYGYNDFKCVGLHSALNGNRATTFISAHDTVPHELKPYVREARIRPGRNGQGIRFCVSELIEFPRHRKPTWHYGITVEGGAGRVLEAPGQYNGLETVLFNGMNGMFVLDREPGGCVLCRGQSGERKHWAIAQFSQNVYPAMPICKACLPQAFSSILEVVNGR